MYLWFLTNKQVFRAYETAKYVRLKFPVATRPQNRSSRARKASTFIETPESTRLGGASSLRSLSRGDSFRKLRTNLRLSAAEYDFLCDAWLMSLTEDD